MDVLKPENRVSTINHYRTMVIAAAAITIVHVAATSASLFCPTNAPFTNPIQQTVGAGG